MDFHALLTEVLRRKPAVTIIINTFTEEEQQAMQVVARLMKEENGGMVMVDGEPITKIHFLGKKKDETQTVPSFMAKQDWCGTCQ